MNDADKKIENFLKTIGECFEGMNPKTQWPLNAGQIDAYFDVGEALDIYNRINFLKRSISKEEICDLLPDADILRIFILNNGIIGLKVAKKLGLVKISTQEIVDYTLFLFDIIKMKVHNDPFCLDDKNILYSERQIEKLTESGFKFIEEDARRNIANLIVSSNYIGYTLFYDIFPTGGFINHGPYDVSEFYGKGAVLIARDYHDITPEELWPEFDMPYNKLKILCVYSNLRVGVNFSNHIITNDTISDKLIAYKVLLDDKLLTISEIEELTKFFNKKIKEQSDRVNSFSDFDKVRKGGEIAFYFFKKLREYMGDDWKYKPLMDEIDFVIGKFGREFIEKYKYKKKPDIEHYRKLFDPRIDYY